jgi:hypothetical protein
MAGPVERGRSTMAAVPGDDDVRSDAGYAAPRSPRPDYVSVVRPDDGVVVGVDPQGDLGVGAPVGKVGPGGVGAAAVAMLPLPIILRVRTGKLEFLDRWHVCGLSSWPLLTTADHGVAQAMTAGIVQVCPR